MALPSIPGCRVEWEDPCSDNQAACAVKQTLAVIGHSFGGLLIQILAGRGLAVASVAIDPAPFRGVLPLPIPSGSWQSREMS
jgi:pimeloyl-ACP methyl ester carboxylesterase